MGGFKFMCCTAPKVYEGPGQVPNVYGGPQPVGQQAPYRPPIQGAPPRPGAPPHAFQHEPPRGFSSPPPRSGFVSPPPEVEDETAITRPRPPPSKPRPNVQWVIGLDFGTTFSGFAYAKATGEEQINTYYDWPSRSPTTPYCKTITGIYYTQTAPGRYECQSWGNLAVSDAIANDARRGAPQGVYLCRFKLLLKRDLNDPVLTSSIPAPLTVDIVITDYLRQIGELALQVIRNHEGDARFRRDSVHWCVTVPSIWDEASKQRMKACMMSAGLVTVEMGGFEAVTVVLEPEAASFHCHQILQREINERRDPREVTLQKSDRILVADVGGGTVDIVVQEILSTGSDYRVQELTESSGGLCGGTFVDASFLNFLSRKIECFDDFLRSAVPSYRSRLLKDWDGIKCAFGHDTSSSATTEIILHPRLAKMWEKYDKEQQRPERESYTEVALTQDDLRFIFDPTVDEIIQLIAAQLMNVENIRVIFVVGGFAGSPYLLQRIRARFADEVEHIVSPPNPGSAIIQGAVSLARNPNGYDVSRILKKTYGTSITLRDFRPGVDPPHFLRVDSDGNKWCRNRFDIFVRRGSRVAVNQVVTKEYVPHADNQSVMNFDLYSCNEQEPRFTEAPNVTKEGGFSVTLPSNYNRNNLPLYRFSIYFGRSSIELKVEAQFQQSRGEKPRTLELPVTYYG